LTMWRGSAVIKPSSGQSNWTTSKVSLAVVCCVMMNATA